jgi:hypothetical protein
MARSRGLGDVYKRQLMNWVDPVEEFPQIKEWEQLHDEIKKLQPVADQELKSLRERRGN